MKNLEELLNRSASMHRHLCPRQVLGIRIGLLAGQLLSIDVPQKAKRLLTIAETDGCAVDGISVATNCTVGHRTLRIEDYGKIAATFVDTESGEAIRTVPHPESRKRAYEYAPEGSTTWQAQLIGYQHMPDEKLFVVQNVELIVPLAKLMSRPGRKAICQCCGEEIINEREVFHEGEILCRACAGQAYYRLKGNKFLLELSNVAENAHAV